MPPPRFERRDFLGEALRAQELGAPQRQAEERRRALESQPCPPDPQLQVLLSDFVIRMNRTGRKPPYVLLGSEKSSQGSYMGWKLSPDGPPEIMHRELDSKTGSSYIKPWQGIAVGTNLSLWKASTRRRLLHHEETRFLDVEPFRGPSIIGAIEKHIPSPGPGLDGTPFNTVYEYIAYHMARVIRGE